MGTIYTPAINRGAEWDGPESGIISAFVEKLGERRKWIILLGISLANAIEVANRISINVILPDMQGNVAANGDEISWVLTLYNAGFICAMALSSGLRRALGARRHFLFSTALYSAGALGCFLSAHNLNLLLLSRLIMGFGGGAFLVRMVVVTYAMFPGKKALKPTTLGLGFAFGAQIIYPPVMGWINDQLHWNYAFLMDLPFLAVSALIVWWYLPAGHMFVQTKQKRFDWWGTISLIVGMLALQTLLNRGERDMWLESPKMVGCLILSVLGLGLFVYWELFPRNVEPVLNLRKVLENLSLRASFSLVMVLGSILGTVLFILPQYLRTVQNFSATQTGEIFSFYGIGLTIGALLSLWVIVPRLGGLTTTIVGFLLMGALFVLSIYLWTPETPTYALATLMLLQGLALGPQWFGVANMAIGQVDRAHVSEADATYYFLRQLGNSFGVAFATVLLDRRLTFHSARMLETTNRLDSALMRYLTAVSGLVARNGGGGSVPGAGALQIFQDTVVVQTRVLAYIDIAAGLALICVLGAILALMVRGKFRVLVHHGLRW